MCSSACSYNPCSFTRAEHLDSNSSDPIGQRKEKILKIAAAVFGVFAVVGGAALLIFAGNFASIFCAVVGFIAIILGSMVLGGILVSVFRQPLVSVIPSKESRDMILSYQELLEEAEEDLKEVEALLQEKSIKLEEAQQQLESLRRDRISQKKDF